MNNGAKCLDDGTTLKWKLSADGRTLTYTISYVMSSDFGGAGGFPSVPVVGESGGSKLVYRRAP
jgi:hypothetical protein